MREWMDPAIVDSLSSCWADFSAENTAVALSACVELFESLSERTAIVLGIDPFPVDKVRGEIGRLLALRRKQR